MIRHLSIFRLFLVLGLLAGCAQPPAPPTAIGIAAASITPRPTQTHTHTQTQTPAPTATQVWPALTAVPRGQRTWVRGQNMPTLRLEMNSAVLDGKIYVASGISLVSLAYFDNTFFLFSDGAKGNAGLSSIQLLAYAGPLAQ